MKTEPYKLYSRSFEYFSQISSKSIVMILSYTVSKLVRFWDAVYMVSRQGRAEEQSDTLDKTRTQVCCMSCYAALSAGLVNIHALRADDMYVILSVQSLAANRSYAERPNLYKNVS